MRTNSHNNGSKAHKSIVNKAVMSTLCGVSLLAAGAVGIPEVIGYASAESASDTTEVEVTIGSVIAITSPEKLSITTTSTPDGRFSTASGEIDVSTTNESGYKLSLAMNDGSTSSDLVNKDDSDKTIPNLTAQTTATEFPVNHWGFSLDDPGIALNIFQPLPGVGSPMEIKDTSEAAASDKTDFSIGTKVDSTVAPGTYAATLKFTAVTNS